MKTEDTRRRWRTLEEEKGGNVGWLGLGLGLGLGLLLYTEQELDHDSHIRPKFKLGFHDLYPNLTWVWSIIVQKQLKTMMTRVRSCPNLPSLHS